MSVVKSKYERLVPRNSCLQDEVVLAQAWKKSHTYIRRYNWYADTLELDCSAVCLDERISEWATSLADGTYKPDRVWLVPAPKSGLWAFRPSAEGGWSPYIAAGDEAPVLRPLAHIGIREQTVATAVMLCLADCIESAQGDPSVAPSNQASRGAFSYGNRLFCNWNSDGMSARFPWGNADTYSRYFQDYQRFVERPTAIAQSVDAAKEDDELVYIAKLDISAFFDNVDLDRLIDTLKTEYEAFVGREPAYMPASESFWATARTALTFEWRAEDLELAPLFRDKKLPQGLPQGLVSSGFFANAYLLEFDRNMGKSIGRTIHQKSYHLRIQDYCRYVDDLRVVFSVRREDNDDIDEHRLAEDVSSWLQRKLKVNTKTSRGGYLRINPSKTELELFSAIGGESRTSARMKVLQQQLSGPFDLDTLQQVEAGLSGLLSLAELGLKERVWPALEDQSLALATVAKTKLEVRDDTLTRFSAYRLTRSLRIRRSMTALEESHDGVSAKEALTHDFEAAARRLIASWAVNPSLVQVLRYALDLYPSAELLKPIAQALTTKLSDGASSTRYEERVVFYVLAELFKAGATETGQRAQQDAAFQVVDVAAYRIELATLAQNILEYPDVPWYVQQQASLLLASVGQPTADLGLSSELRRHRSLHSFLRGRVTHSEIGGSDEPVVSLVGHQLLNDKKHYVAWFRKFALRRGREAVSKALRLIGQTVPELFAELTRPAQATTAAATKGAPRYLSSYAAATWPSDGGPLPEGKWLTLVSVMTHPSAPFGQENALLNLALQLVELPRLASVPAESLTPINIEVRCNDWSLVNDPRRDVLRVRQARVTPTRDPVYATPPWCREEDAWMYAVGRLLRAAATGEPDFTVRRWLMREEVGWYQGIRSTWQKRRMGMLHTADALKGTSAAITPWLSEVLLGLLRWPGMAERNSSVLDDVSSPRDLSALLQTRLEGQKRIYGESSNLAVYRYPVNWNLRRDRGLRVALVQGLMPMQKDFASGFEGLSVPGYRERHRNHTAALLHLASRHIAARDYVLGQPDKPHVDLVIFPEYTIHVDDQDLMRAFSDATGAMLFYGLLGAVVPGTNDRVNAGRWLVPQRSAGRRSWVEVDQGKWHLTEEEKALGVKPWRPYQVVIELVSPNEEAFRISGSICYDATDLALAADLRDESHMYAVAAMNKDVKTFDGMVAALRYHMYQHVVIANCGEFGGSTAQAPYDQDHRRLVTHTHGSEQLAISVFDVRIDDFGPKLEAAKVGTPVKKTVIQRIGKTPPAGLKR